MTQEAFAPAKELAEQIRGIAERAANEEELRIGVEQLLAPVRQQFGISSRYESSYSVLVSGFSDAVYGHAVIEYKKPGRLSLAAGRDEAVWGTKTRGGKRRGGLVQYMQGEAYRGGGDSEEALRRVVGIALDGYSILFVRYRGDRPPLKQDAAEETALVDTQLSLIAKAEPVGRFTVLGPSAIDENSVAEFLVHLRALRRQRLTAEALERQFGPRGEVAQQVVNALCSRLDEALTAPGDAFRRIETFYHEWERIFGIVYGQELVKAERDAQQLAKLYGVTEFTDLKPLLFAVHTYFALLMKLLAAELLSLQRGAILASLVQQLPALPGDELQARLANLEDGTYFAAQGIRNFLEADFFGWYLDAWDAEIENAIRDMARTLAEFEPATGTLDPEATRDLLKKLYQYLIPRKLRHDLGEFYTPDWLAELLLNDLGYSGNPEERVLDPACGSGTFLVLAIRRILDYAQDSIRWRGQETELAQRILENVVGFDLNPLAVIAARTNYLLALGPLVRHLVGRDIPVYLCDSILTPKTIRPTQVPPESPDTTPVPTTQKDFWIPNELVDGGQVDALCRLLEQCVGKYSIEDFLGRARREIGWASSYTETSLATLYQKVQQLEAEGRNGLWARLIKNAFAPVFRAATPFDFVAGNPPWVNWESLADDYREATKRLWQDYGLFSLKGHAARLGGGKKDVAMLMLYTAMESYLRDGGKLGFVITQTVFKTKGAGDGFRRFRLGKDIEGIPLKVLSVNDLVELQPFEGATNRTATVVLRKGVETTYPVAYTLWRKAKPGRIGTELSLAEVQGRTARTVLDAQPVDQAKVASPWLTASPRVFSAIKRMIGKSDYQAHAGACTWANGIYWLRIVERRPDGLLVVENLHDVGKKKVKSVRAAIEPDLLYPLLRGRDVRRWQAKPSAYILMVQDPVKRKGYDESWLKVNYPETYAYLKQFEDVLRERSGYKKYFKPQDPFYSMYDVAEYTFAPYKVLWPWIATGIRASVVSRHNDKVTVPEHNTSFASFPDEKEAHYFCALLGSSSANIVIRARTPGGGGGLASPTILEHVAIPRFDPANPLHQSLAALSQRAHGLAAKGKEGEQELRQVEAEIDLAAARLWGLSADELAETQRALAELA